MVNIAVVVLLVSTAIALPAFAQDDTEVVLDESRMEEDRQAQDDARIERMLQRADRIDEEAIAEDEIAYEDPTDEDGAYHARSVGRGPNDDTPPPEERDPTDIGISDDEQHAPVAEADSNTYRSGSGLSGAYRSSFMGGEPAPKTMRPVDKAGMTDEAGQALDAKKKRRE